MEIFDIKWFGKIVLQILLLAPCIYLHLLGSAILSEAIAYPLFLIFFGLGLKMFVNESFEDIFKIFLLLVALVLTRGQFIALVPAFLIIVIYTIIKNGAIRNRWYVLIILLAVPLMASLVEKTYNKINYDHFVGNTMNYVHLISSPFYLSNANDIDVFSQEDQKAYFNLIYKNLESRKLLYNQIDLNKSDNYQFYHRNFSNICNKGVYKLGLDFFKNKGFDYYQQHIQLNKLCKSMLLPLIKQNFQSWIYLYIKNVKNSFGSFKQLLLFLLLLIYGLIYLDVKNNNFYKFLVMAIIFMFANNCLVAIPIHTIKRYIFYFDWVIFAVFIILIEEKLRNRIAYEC
ncbi:hypothetical protein [Algibacter mikhailovii]|uniref:hypothetical protein n=1 Tax=Algibacter mikhailovii TaxID=425498 RepID=UPI00167BD2C0|nr:hypothetical protein [Algibacter mikhailovii]